MIAMPAALAWDVDGTLVDSEPLHLEALLRVSSSHGIDISDFGPTQFVGIAIHDVWRQLAPRFGSKLATSTSDGFKRFCRSINEQYLARAHTLQPMSGSLETLQWLKQRKLPMCAVSNSNAPIVHANLRAIGADHFFDFVITLDDVTQPKPHPEPYARACSDLGLAGPQVLAVEDSASGLQSAKAAGLTVLLVAGLSAAVPPGDAAPRHLLRTLHDFVPWWEGTEMSIRVQKRMKTSSSNHTGPGEIV